MAFPTAVITQGSGLTVNTLPNAGQATMTNSLGVAIASDQSVIPTTSLNSGAITNPTSILTRPANTTAYASGQLIADNVTAGSIGSHSFAISTSAGGAIIPRLRLRTNATSGWGGVNVSINLWSAAPTYTNGDGGAYAPATGGASWLTNFLVSAMVQFGDGAVGAGSPTIANEMMIKLASGTAIFWDLQILSAAIPTSGQTFTLTAEILN
jgi:hypothetical protein